MGKLYHYIGPNELSGSVSERRLIQNPQDVRNWIDQTRQRPENGRAVATFIVDAAEQLWVADRHSEHVACAAGQPVLSAGEMTFVIDRRQVSVVEVTNQSLGYCPESASWPAVSAALEHSRLPHPSDFTSAYTIELSRDSKKKAVLV